MSDRLTNTVDLSDVAVDNAASFIDEMAYPHTAAMLRALRLKLTIMTQDRDAKGEDARFLSDSLDALTKERDSAFNQVDELRAELTASQEALKRYSWHGGGEVMCERVKGGSYPCTCGLEALLQESAK
jgi:hypothetical protein